jgi:diacylglycerol kinase family enzyme
VPKRRSALILFNSRAGSNNASNGTNDVEMVRRAFALYDLTATIVSIPANELTAATRRAAENRSNPVDVIVAAGGDGTLSAVASALVGTDTPLGILPMGTLNHFAKDLAIPMDLEAAVQTIATGVAHRVDVAEVNGRIFLNNSSIGLYPRLVIRRDRQMERLGRGKWTSLAVAMLSLFRGFPILRVRLLIDGKTHLHETPFVFVGNNLYQIELFNLGTRTRLDSNELCCYFTTRTGRFALVRLAIRAMLGRLSQAKDFHGLCTKEVWIDSVKPRLHVSADGEVLTLETPLHYVIKPAALNVIVPAPTS